MNKKREAFSLLELLLVVALLLIFVYGGSWLIKFLNQQKVEMNIKKIVNDIQYAKSLAYKSGYSEVKFEKDCKPNIDCYELTSKDFYKKVFLLKDVRLESETFLRFKKDLLPQSAGHVVLQTPYGKYKIIWDNISGNVRWEKEN